MNELEELRQVDRADAYRAGELAATLTRTRDGVVFAYLPEWVELGRPALATTLPVTQDLVPRPGGALPAFFEGLLPEGRRLSAVRRAVKTSADDELTLLLAVGADTIGDVVVVPAGVRPEDVPPRVTLDADDLDFTLLLADLGVHIDRVGLPGVQDKASAAMVNLPVARRGERYLLKLDPPEYAHLVANEAFFISAAHLTGLPTVDATTVHDKTGRPGLLVRRFDRVVDGGKVTALAVEDGCQVLGRPPADKYVVGTEEVFEALAAVCDAPLVAARALVQQLAFAFVTGNGDAHAKNFAVLQHPTGERRVSPAYDLPSSQPYGDTSLALPVAGRVVEDVGARDFVALGQRLGLREPAVRRAVTTVAERVERWLPDLDRLPFDEQRLRTFRRVVQYRRDRLLAG